MVTADRTPLSASTVEESGDMPRRLLNELLSRAPLHTTRIRRSGTSLHSVAGRRAIRKPMPLPLLAGCRLVALLSLQVFEFLKAHAKVFDGQVAVSGLGHLRSVSAVPNPPFGDRLTSVPTFSQKPSMNLL